MEYNSSVHLRLGIVCQQDESWDQSGDKIERGSRSQATYLLSVRTLPAMRLWFGALFLTILILSVSSQRGLNCKPELLKSGKRTVY